MKFAIVSIGGKQYNIKEKSVISVEKIDKKAGHEVSFDKVVLCNDGKKFLIGSPFCKGVKVTAKILSQGQAKKVRLVKFKSKVRYRRTKGHRQRFTKIKIEKITAA